MNDYQDLYYDSRDGLRLYARDYAHAKPRANILCLHGLTRNSADFNRLCSSLNDDYRLIAVDQRGRGKSAYDPDPANYNPLVYVQDMFTLLDHLQLERVTAIGTSMGGIIAMLMGSSAAHRFSGIVLNDVGPEIDPVGLDRIRGYVGRLEAVRNWDDAVEQVKATNGIAFEDYTGPDWEAFARNVYVEDDNGIPQLAHDPAIAESVRPSDDGAPPPSLWPVFDTLSAIPMMVIRGATSDILAASCVAQMQARHGDLTVLELPGRGHAPMLDEAGALSGICNFLRDTATG